MNEGTSNILAYEVCSSNKKETPVGNEKIITGFNPHKDLTIRVIQRGRGVMSRGEYGANAPDELNQSGGHMPPLKMPLIKFEIVCFCT